MDEMNGPDYLLVECRLHKNVLDDYSNFNKLEIFEIMDNSLKFVLNMVPFNLIDVLTK